MKYLQIDFQWQAGCGISTFTRIVGPFEGPVGNWLAGFWEGLDMLNRAMVVRGVTREDNAIGAEVQDMTPLMAEASAIRKCNPLDILAAVKIQYINDIPAVRS